MANQARIHLISLFDELSENLNNNDIEKLTSLCRVFIPPEELRKVRNPMGFLSILWNSRLIDVQHVSFLKGLIKNLNNPALAKSIENYEVKHVRKRIRSLDSSNPLPDDNEVDIQQIIQQFKNHKIESNNEILQALSSKNQFQGQLQREFSSIARSNNYYRARNTLEDKSQPLPCQRAGSPMKIYIGTRNYANNQQTYQEDLCASI